MKKYILIISCVLVMKNASSQTNIGATSKSGQGLLIESKTGGRLPFQEVGGPTLTFKTAADPYVNSNGLTKDGNAYFQGGATNYFASNVGVGTYDTKGYKLAVAGNMIAESVKVKLQGAWPDYVFTKDYVLPTLEETERQIREKGHLPGIPSTDEVKEKGLDLGEMNVKLLQKIEELTLHLIEKEKIVENLKTRNQVIEQNQKTLQSSLEFVLKRLSKLENQK